MGLRGLGAAPGGRERPGGVIRYLLDSSALWRILRDAALRAAWAEVVSLGVIGSCHPQRVEFRRSARTLDEYEQMSGMFDALYPDAAVPKAAWRWVESAQYRLLRHGAHRALSAVDLLICATAAHHDLAILHDDNDFAVAARHVPDLRERSVRDVPDALQPYAPTERVRPSGPADRQVTD
jgi:predicted nucleic acid-binding protein